MTTLEKIMMNVEGKIWTRRDEMIEELEELDYVVIYICYEYVGIIDLHDDDEAEFILYLGHAGTTMWIESAKEAI